MLKLFAFSLILVSVTGHSYDPVNFVRASRSASDFRTSNAFKKDPKFILLKSDEKREIFHYEQTIVIRDSGKDDDKVRRCQVFEVYKQEEAKEFLSELNKLLKLKEKEVLMDKMMDLLKDCDSVDDNYVKPPMPKLEPGVLPNTTFGENPLFNGIIPGTNWCGFGDIANNYTHLSGLRDVDRCCRAHDFCPIKVLAKDELYNLKNTAKYTKSHCRCDEAFYYCLKKDKGWSAKLIGNMYFYLARPECIVGLPEMPERMTFVPAIKKW